VKKESPKKRRKPDRHWKEFPQELFTPDNCRECVYYVSFRRFLNSCSCFMEVRDRESTGNTLRGCPEWVPEWTYGKNGPRERGNVD